VLKYSIVIERAKRNYSAYVPDLPGCIATGKTKAETERNIRSAIKMHIEGLEEDNLPIPEPQTTVKHVAV
jgi:predicted RNase H-like HicB family nuclease